MHVYNTGQHVVVTTRLLRVAGVVVHSQILGALRSRGSPMQRRLLKQSQYQQQRSRL